MEQKFQRGFRVEILSRNPEVIPSRWENSAVGSEAIIQYSNLEKPESFDWDFSNYDSGVCYSLLIFRPGTGCPSFLKWFEEKYLQLICCNDAKGKLILDAYNV